MKFAIIAAGEGSRLANEGIRQPKPLVVIAGETMIERLVRIFKNNDAEEIVIIINEQQTDTRHYLERYAANSQDCPIRIVVKSTPSSMHSLAALKPWLQDSPFCLTTVDTIFQETDFRRYIQDFRLSLLAGGEGLMGVTDYEDDEKPLYVSTDATMRITGFYDSPTTSAHLWISGGIYGLTPKAFNTLQSCLEQGQERMRNFQRQLIRDGVRLRAHVFPKILDIDHASDISKAEVFLAAP